MFPQPDPVPHFTLGKFVYEPVKLREVAGGSAHLITGALNITALPSIKEEDARVNGSDSGHRGENCGLITRS